MSADPPPPLGDFLTFAKKKKKGYITLLPKTGKPPLKVYFSTKIIPGEGAKGTFHYQDRVIYLEGDGFAAAHVKGFEKTLREDGWFTTHVALDGDVVEIEGSEFDEVTDDWDQMKAVLERHPMSVPVRRRYDRIEALLKASPPNLVDIRKALRVLDPEVARLKTAKGGHGQTSEVAEKVRINDASKIARVRTAWARLERQVRSAPMTRAVREDLELMERLVASPAPDEKALTATLERLVDFVALSKGKAPGAGPASGDATAKAVHRLLDEWQRRIVPELNRIIAFRVKSAGGSAADAAKLAALAKQLPVMLQGQTPDLDRAKKTFALFDKARTEMAAAGPAG